MALLVIAALLFSASVVAVFVRTQLLNTDRYVETVAPLARDPAVQDAITNRLTDEFMTRLDIAGLTQQLVTALEERGAPEILGQLTGPILSGVRNFVRTEIHKVVTSDRFAQVWDSANRIAHDELNAVLTTGQGQFLTTQGAEISLNVGALLTVVKQRLVDAGFGLASRVPNTSITVPLFHVEDLPRIRTAVSVLNVLYWLLPLLALAPASRRCVGGAEPPSRAARRIHLVRHRDAAAARRAGGRPNLLPEQPPARSRRRMP